MELCTRCDTPWGERVVHILVHFCEGIPERIRAGEFERDFGKTIHQDYLLLKNFENEEDRPCIILLPGVSAYTKISKIMRLMNEQLTLKKDGYWPCRSRSYMLELLSFISYVCALPAPQIVQQRKDDTEAIGTLCSMYTETDIAGNDLVSDIIQYMGAHIEEKISQEDITKKFSVNSNALNKMFIKETSMTWLNYFTKMRINLAQIMLAETELQVAEIAGRVGYDDSNYFIKVFKKYTGVAPSKYRDSFW